MPRYIAVEPIEHTAGRTEPGGTLELDEDQAAQALAIGHIRPAVRAARSQRAPATDAAGQLGDQAPERQVDHQPGPQGGDPGLVAGTGPAADPQS